MAWEGKNHYLFMLEGGDFMLSQNGEYLQALYILYYPFTLLSWEYAKISWMTINTLLAFFLPIFIGRKFELKNYTLLILVCLFDMLKIVVQITFKLLFKLGFDYHHIQSHLPHKMKVLPA